MPVFLFPGQGSQKAGVAKTFYDASAAARNVLERALSLLPESVAAVLLEGAQENLNDTRNAQPVLLCLETAIAAHLSTLGIQATLCAGHSLGEISALTAAGAIPFEDAVSLVLERARLMSENVPEGGMAAVFGMAAEEMEPLLSAEVQVANYNGPAQTIISGESEALKSAIAVLKQHGAKRIVPLRVSGPFHSRLMQPAASALETWLKSVPIASPQIPFLSSVSGCIETEPERIRSLLAAQLCSPVQWTKVMEQLDGRRAIEVGPGTVLAGLAKRAPKAPHVLPAETPDACRQLLVQ